MFKRVLFFSAVLAFTSHSALANCAHKGCNRLMQGQVVMHPSDEMSGYVCYPYQYQSNQDASQTLGFLKGGHEVYHAGHMPDAEYVAEPEKINAFSASDDIVSEQPKPVVKKKKKRAKKAVHAPKKEAVVKDAYNEDVKPQSHVTEKEEAKKPAEPAAKEEQKPIAVEPPKAEEKTTPQVQAPAPVKEEPKPMSSEQQPLAATPTPASASSSNVARATVIDFAEKEIELSYDQKSTLDSVADDLRTGSSLVTKIHSYGYASDGDFNEARRRSLQRAIKIRKYLLDKDINATRISVNAIDDSAVHINKVEIMLEDGSR